MDYVREQVKEAQWPGKVRNWTELVLIKWSSHKHVHVWIVIAFCWFSLVQMRSFIHGFFEVTINLSDAEMISN
jgi:hypothetical protein